MPTRTETIRTKLGAISGPRLRRLAKDALDRKTWRVENTAARKTRLLGRLDNPADASRVTTLVSKLKKLDAKPEVEAKLLALESNPDEDIAAIATYVLERDYLDDAEIKTRLDAEIVKLEKDIDEPKLARLLRRAEAMEDLDA